MGRASFRSSSKPASSAPKVTTPQPAIHHHTTSYQPPTLGQSMKDGFGLGVGSAIAQRVVSGIFGAPTVNIQQSDTSVIKQEPIKVVGKFDKKAFEACMEENYNNYDSCKKHLEEGN